MTRQVLLEARCRPQLAQLYEAHQLSFGLIIGQPSVAGPEYVIHLAHTKVESIVPANKGTIEKHHIPELLDHCFNVLRMLTGGFYVLGLFVVSRKLPEEKSEEYESQVQALRQVYKTMLENVRIFGSVDTFEKADKVLLSFAGSEAIRCNTVRFVEATDDAGKVSVSYSLKAASLKFEETPIPWAQLRTTLEEPFCFRITRTAEGTVDINDNVQETLRIVHARLSQSQIFVQNDPAMDKPHCSVEALFKLDKKANADLKARLFFEVEDPVDEKRLRVDRWSGFIKCMGDVSSHVFIHPKMTVQDMNRFVQTDIMRSISGRLRLYLDAYTGLSSEQRVHKIYQILPPRRVYFKAFDESLIQFSEFLFTGETTAQVVENAKDTFGIIVDPKAVNEKEKMRYPTKAINDEMKKPTTDMARIFLKASDWCCWSIIMVALLALVGAIVIQVWFNIESIQDEQLQTHHY